MMLYPRITKVNDSEILVSEDQMCGYKEHMLQKRTLFWSGLIGADFDLHNLLLTLDTISHDPIKLVITSVGGDLDATFLFYDTMRLIKAPVITIGRYCASAAAIILAAGSKRFLFPHAKVMLHLPSAVLQGDTHDISIAHAQMLMYQNNIVKILNDNGVKLSPEKIFSDIDRPFWLEPSEAIKYGLADEIINPEKWEGLCR